MQDAHLSGFHGATRKQWRRAFKKLTALVDVVGVTEGQNLHRVPAGWALWAPRGGEAECAIAWDTAVHTQPRWPASKLPMAAKHSLTNQAFTTGTGAVRHGVTATWTCLDNNAGHRRLRIVVHLPSAVQLGQKWSAKRPRVLAWAAAMVGLRQLIKTLRRTTHCHDVVVSFDTNVDLSMAVWQRTLRTALVGTGLQLVVPPKPTHDGGRRIDAYATSMHVVDIDVLPPFPGFDHKPIVTVQSAPTRKRKP